MAVSKVVNPNLVQKVAVTPVTNSSNYEFGTQGSTVQLFVTRCGKIVNVCALVKVKSDGTPNTNYPGERMAQNMPKPAHTVWTAFPQSFNAVSQFASLGINIAEGSGDLYVRWGTVGRTYTVNFTYITSD